MISPRVPDKVKGGHLRETTSPESLSSESPVYIENIKHLALNDMPNVTRILCNRFNIFNMY